MVIPYGTTTDQIEWFFAATGADQLTAPPDALLTMGGTSVAIDKGAKVDVSGGGDLYAYEFIPGTGGSHDVLDRINTDPFSSNTGYQYPDDRQVYAIVPSLSNATAAAFDPIFSSDYTNLYSASGAGRQVYLGNVPGLAPGWYTLLPAKYATLPGGMRIVENATTTSVAPGYEQKLKDGSYVVSGYYGSAGTSFYDSTLHSFTVQTQATFDKYSNIALTSANAKFAADAAKNGTATPQLPIDAGRLILAPTDSLTIDSALTTTPGKGGRGAEVDITSSAFDIVGSGTGTGAPGAVVLNADDLTNLNAGSLLIGGVRTDNADGTTSLAITAHDILVENDAAHPLSGPEIVLAVDGSGAGITLANGATIIATGTPSVLLSGDYVIDGSQDGMTGQGAVLRVSQGPQRQVTRENPVDLPSGFLSVGEADLEGTSILLESSGDLTASPTASLVTENLALGAGQVSFTNDGTGLSGLVIGDALEALISKVAQLTIRTPGEIAFADGTYDFQNLTLDSQGLSFLGTSTGSVNLDAGTLTLSNSGVVGTACAQDCASSLNIHATEVDFASGTIGAFGFAADTIVATKGIFAQGDATFDAGAAALIMQTPFIGDEALVLTPGQTPVLPSLSFVTTGAVTISNPGDLNVGDFAGTPGATLSISGGSVAISGTTLRATAGTLDIDSAGGIVVASGATLSTPGYQKNFGDAADPYIVSAPGGLVNLTAQNGNIDLMQGSLLSVGGGAGTAGTIEVAAPTGTVNFDGTLDARAPDSGGSLMLDQNSSFDLANFSAMFGNEFDGTIAIRTGTGDLVLAAGDTFKAQNVMLTADGGLVDIAARSTSPASAAAMSACLAKPACRLNRVG